MNPEHHFQSGSWRMECDLADGARIRRLRFQEADLLTAKPEAFRPPQADYGRYETRPVFAYDDCFPTVEQCAHWPDHGEVCWLPWSGTPVDCHATSALAPLRFSRRLDFKNHRLLWSFAVENSGSVAIPVQHVMHPLFPLDEVETIQLPAGDGYEPHRLATELLAACPGTFRMDFLRGIKRGEVRIGFRQGLQLAIRFPTSWFPTLGIWWNNRGYPNEVGLHRSECSFQPVAGPDSRLTSGTTMTVPPRGRLNWEIEWEVSCR